MLNKSVTLIAVIAALMMVSASAFAYDFWGVSVGTATHDGSTQLTFDGLDGSDIQYTVGGYKYTCVDGSWYGPFPAAIPGEGFLASRKSDAQGLFFKADEDFARFTIVTGASQTGSPAPECGAGTRLFGTGDLMIETESGTFGVGMRLDNLLWAVDPLSTLAHHQIYAPDNTVLSMFSRDAGTLGDVELNPSWARAGNQSLPAGSTLAPAFFISGSGAHVGSANVSFADTGIVMEGARVYAYEVSVPWTTLGLDPVTASFSASWRPDCGNDLISAQFTGLAGAPSIPEPCTTFSILGGLMALASSRKRG